MQKALKEIINEMFPEGKNQKERNKMWIDNIKKISSAAEKFSDEEILSIKLYPICVYETDYLHFVDMQKQFIKDNKDKNIRISIPDVVGISMFTFASVIKGLSITAVKNGDDDNADGFYR